ncbi:MAG: hypothetical protein A2Y15_00765 [Clostridiales bacterium GWF2_36_10]|nr:MAG: hypothetical protein A2Y15_00765 [Clostridiales bacterium GWF2_36_10]HAN21500.1 hypothetical protein [Clostridiales bacterium]
MQDVVVNKCMDSMKKTVRELAYPALLLDKDYKICCKNDFCINRIIPLRMGSSIKYRLNASDFKRLIQQQVGETIRVSIDANTLCWAYVYRGDDYYFIGLRTLTATLQNRISELMQLNTDLTESLLCQMSVISSDGEIGLSELIKHKCNRIIRSQQHISEFLRIVNGVKNTKTQLCDIDAILNAVIISLRDALRPLGVQINYNGSADMLKSRYALICEPDFNIVLCLMIYNSIRISQSEKLRIDTNTINGKLYISILTDSVLPENTAKFICEGDLETENFSSPDSWIYFELLLIKKLCEYYLWDISFSAPGSDYSRLQITLSITLEREIVSEMSVNDNYVSERERKRLFALEFADFFDRYY